MSILEDDSQGKQLKTNNNCSFTPEANQIKRQCMYNKLLNRWHEQNTGMGEKSTIVAHEMPSFQ